MLRRWLALVLAAIALGLASWIFLPAPTYFLLTFGVGAPEVSAWLILLSLLAAAFAVPDVRERRRSGRVALAVSTAALLLSVTPFARFPATARCLDDAMRAELGGDPLRAVPAEFQARMRPRPLIVGELFRGVAIGEAKVTRDIPVAERQGVRLPLDIYRPMERGPHPIVVQIYGGAWQRGDPGSNAEFARWLAARGHIVFAIDYRHAPRWRWPAQLEDVHMALAWIRDHAAEYDGDPARVALIGRSAGAHLALLAAYAAGPLQVRGVVSYYGPTDLVDAWHNPPHPDPLHIRATVEALMGGTPDEMPERYREASPITYATRPLPPTLLVYGGRDHTVEPRYGARLHQRLTATGTTAAYLEIPWAEHAFDAVFNGPSSQLALFHTERFLAWALHRESAGALGPVVRRTAACSPRSAQG